MKTADSWATTGLAETHRLTTHQVADIVRQIQADTLRYAATVAAAAKVPSGTQDWNDGYGLAAKSISILLFDHADKLDVPK